MHMRTAEALVSILSYELGIREDPTPSRRAEVRAFPLIPKLREIEPGTEKAQLREWSNECHAMLNAAESRVAFLREAKKQRRATKPQRLSARDSRAKSKQNKEH